MNLLKIILIIHPNKNKRQRHQQNGRIGNSKLLFFYRIIENPPETIRTNLVRTL